MLRLNMLNWCMQLLPLAPRTAHKREKDAHKGKLLMGSSELPAPRGTESCCSVAFSLKDAALSSSTAALHAALRG
jgi:hypothetical protein